MTFRTDLARIPVTGKVNSTMKRSVQRLVTFGAVMAAATGLAVAMPTVAQAATVGSLQIVPTTGDVINGIQLKTSAPCPATSVGTVAYIWGGPNNWTDPQNDPNGTAVILSGLSTNVNMTAPAPAGQTIALAAQNNSKVLAAGVYNIQLFCYSDLDTVNQTGSFDGTVTLAAAGSGFSYTSSVPVVTAPATATTITAPATANTGDAVALSANVKATALAAGVTATGTVQFRDGATVLATTPATVPVAGLTNAAAGVTVSASTMFATAGTKNITATFIPADASVAATSTSEATPVVVSAVASATTTTLTVSPSAPTTADVITLGAAVSPAGAQGTVTYRDGTTVVGTSGPNSTLSLTGVPAGAHSYTASFVPTDPTAFVASASAAVPVTVTAFAGYNLNGVSGGGEIITATVAAGTLTLTAATTPVDLGTLALDSTNTRLVNTNPASALNPVTITDTRAGQLGYTVSGIAADFVAGSNKINSENLGWTPALTGTVPASVNVTAGPAVASGDGVLVGQVGSPLQGLKVSRVLATSSYNASTNKGSVGTVQVTAGLSLKAPTNTLPGVYSTTLVITAI